MRRPEASEPCARPVQKQVNDADGVPGTGWTVAGLALSFLGGLTLAQVGGGDSEFFFALGFFLAAGGLFCLVVGGVAIGTRLGRD